MAYTGQPVPSTIHNIGYGKISDGKSVRVAVPENTVIEAGKFYLLDGFLGCAFQSVTTGVGETAEVVLNIEQAEYETDQIDTSQTFAKGTLIYWDAANNIFTETSTGNRLAGRVTQAKDANNVICFILGPQVVAEHEPVASTYKFSYEVPADVAAGQEVVVPVTFETDVEGDCGYEGVRFKFEAQGPGVVTFKAKDSNDVEHTFTNEGYWGPASGFNLPAEYSATTDWTLVFSEAGKYTITFSLIDAATGDVIAGITETVEIEVVV